MAVRIAHHVPTTKVIIEKMEELADRSGTTLQLSWKDDIFGIYVLGSQFAVDFASRGQWVNAVFIVLLEELANFKSQLEKALDELSVQHQIRTKELWKVAEVDVRIFASRN